MDNHGSQHGELKAALTSVSWPGLVRRRSHGNR